MMLQVRIVTVDHYMSSPIPELDVTYSDFRKSSIRHVPVIRIFGSTPSGIKTCVHVHGVFPYICIPYDGSEPHLQLSYKLAASLDKAINIASGFSTSNTQHVYKVVLVSGIPFYGYHNKRHQFLKIYFYKPSVIKQAVNLLQNGAILNKAFQPHEAHIPFILQFFIDFNLYGMSFIDFEFVKFRKTNYPELLSAIPQEHILPDTISAVTVSKYEVDASACHIANRPSSQGSGRICNPGIAAIWEDENRRRAMKDGTPVDIPQLHSQRPTQNSTSSELFHLDRIHRILNNPSQSSDESSLSGEPTTLMNKSYAIEEPPNATALDASFVSLHVSNVQGVTNDVTNAATLDDTIVDEDVIFMNSSISQHLSQHLDRTVTLDLEDLELLDVLETLADTRSATVDNDSVLGSQTAKTVCRPSSVGDDDEANSEGEDEHWSEKTLVADEDDPMKLFDLTMPDIDEEAILNNGLNEPQPGPSSSVRDNFHIPQLDGHSDGLLKGKSKSRKVFHIPQLDGANDLLPKPGRKSLGMRRTQTKMPAASKDNVLTDDRYVSGTTDLIFQRKRKNPASSTTVYPPLINVGGVPYKTSLPVHPESQGPCPSTSLGTSNNVALGLNSQDKVEPLVFLVEGTERPSSSLSNVDLFQPYYSENMALHENGIDVNINPAIASGTPTIAYSEENEEIHCTESFIHAVSNSQKEPILRGNPSLYPQAPLDKEESLTELMSSVVSHKTNADGVKFSDDLVTCQEPTSTSSQLPERHECVTQLLNGDAKASIDSWVDTTIANSVNADELADPDGNMTPASISDISVSGIGPLLTTTMYNDIRETLRWSSGSTDASCSDSELSRLKDALDKNDMAEILQTDSEMCIPESSTARRAELIRVIESSQASKPFQDPVTDELLRRGELPRKGPPKLGKNMALAQLYCGTPITQKNTHAAVTSTIGKKELRRARREERRLKLSVTAQKRRRKTTSEAAAESLVKPCSVKLHKITKKNIYYFCKKYGVSVADKSALGMKSYRLSRNSSDIKSPSCSQSSNSAKSPAHARSRAISNSSVFSSQSSNSAKPPVHARSRAITKSSVLSCGRTRRSYSRSELTKVPIKSEDLSDEIPDVAVKAELPRLHDRCLRSKRKYTNEGSDQRNLTTNRVLSPIPRADTPSPQNVNSRTKAGAETALKEESPLVLPQDSSLALQSLSQRESSDTVPEAIKPEEVPCLNDQTAAEIPTATFATETPSKHFHISPGTTPTSIKISCRTLLQFEKECSKGVDYDNEPLINRTKKLKVLKQDKEDPETISSLDETSSKSEELSYVIDTTMMRTGTVISPSGQKSVEISLQLPNSDLGVHCQGLPEVNATLNNNSNAAVQVKYLEKSEHSSNLSQEIQAESKDQQNAAVQVKHLEKSQHSSNLSQEIQAESKDLQNAAVQVKHLEKSQHSSNLSQEIQAESKLQNLQNVERRKNEKILQQQVSTKDQKKHRTVVPSPSGKNRKYLQTILCEPKELPSGNKGITTCKSKILSPTSPETKKKNGQDCVSMLKKQNTKISGTKSKPAGSKISVLSKLLEGSDVKALPLNTRRTSAKGNSKPVPFEEIIPDARSTLLKDFKIPKKLDKGLKDNLPKTEADCNESTNDDSLLVSLETSSIELEPYSSDDGDENVVVPTQKKPSPDTRNPKTISSQILCVDGASTESSSDSCSGSQETGTAQESMSSQQPLKRKRFEEDMQHNTKVQRDSNQNVSDNQRAGTSSEIPSSVAHWFDKRYGPWTMWSPNISPVRGQLSSPPHPFSPENCSESNFKEFAAMSHGCMEEAYDNHIDNKLPSTLSFGQDLLQRLKSMESGVECGRDLKLHTESEPAEVVDSSGKTTTSIQDMFSERSFHLHEDEDDNAEETKSCHSISSENATFPSISSFSRSKIDVENTCCSKQEEFSPVPEFFQSPKMSKAVDVSEEQTKIDHFQNSSSGGQEPMQENRISSCESSDIPCGQVMRNESSHGRVQESTLDNVILIRESSDIPCGQAIQNESAHERVKLSTDLKTLHKPPSRKEVLDSLHFCNIPEVVVPEPYFSNFIDVKGKVEVGSNLLELTSKNCIHLEEFRSSIDGLRGLSCQQKQLFASCWGLSQVKGNFNDLVTSHLNKSITVIAPVKKPPKVKDVVLWIKAKGMALEARKTDLKNKEKESNQLELSIPVDASSVKLSQTNSKIEGSTPVNSVKKRKGKQVASPLLTPILTRSQSKANQEFKKYSKSQSTDHSLLPCVNERDEIDLGVAPLDNEAQIEVSNVSQNDSHGSSSVKQLLLDSQFCKDAASPLFRHDSDASACQIKGIASSPGFKMVLENLQTVKTKQEYQYITTLTMEVHICTCGALNPDPERDPIRAIFYCVCNDVPENGEIPASVNGIIAVNSNTTTPVLNRCGINGVIEYVDDEKSLLQSLVALVHKWDPDILAGFEIEMLSWGYVLQRACVLGVNISQQFSRITDQRQDKQQDIVEDNNGFSGLKITGRIVLDAWRLFRSEVALQSYTFENLMYHILHQRVCHHSFESLSRWWEHPSHLQRWITVQYYQQRVSGIIRLLDQLDIIGRTSELARLFGIQFFEVLSRGSQFRVESMMLRLAKPLNFIPASPSVQQRAHMRAPECLPLIMEPESRFYNDPMIVLDFQSLYPSMIIAYNYCFSTCLGRVEHLGKSGHFEFGCTELRVKNSHLRQLKDSNNISVSPSGVAFVNKRVRQGVLPRMLEEILEARLAVKQSKKIHKKDHTLQRVLHARQLGLKLIANVTYGYTSANFSGRMPCIEVGDSVVSKGRETLERAISLVHKNKDWRARVVYGDTDSLFVLIPGRSREEAFRIGSEIASAVTQDNPSPVKLKLEKVYQPCILQTKKRYVGFMYESPDQAQPVYEAKGIETVRRDGCPAVAKMLEKSLKILFETRDVSSVKNYVSHQFSKILAGRANIQDLIFAREYRGKENYRAGACVPALELTKRWLRHDRRSEPRIGERVPYVVTNGAPGSALIHLVRHPRELLSDPSLRYNAVYYVTRAIIPPLARCFSLLGADVLSWYSDLPRKSKLSLPVVNQVGFKKTISQYFSTMECACCGALTHGGVCGQCQSKPQLLVTSLMSKLHNLELTHTSITKICQSCLGRAAPLDCTSLDCPITYRRHQSSQKSEQIAFISQVLNDFGLSMT